MTRKFSEIKALVENETDLVVLYRLVDEACVKLERNIKKLQFMSFTKDSAIAEHYFQNVVPEWQKIVDEIVSFWTAAVVDLSTEEIVKIISAKDDIVQIPIRQMTEADYEKVKNITDILETNVNNDSSENEGEE